MLTSLNFKWDANIPACCSKPVTPQVISVIVTNRVRQGDDTRLDICYGVVNVFNVDIRDIVEEKSTTFFVTSCITFSLVTRVGDASMPHV